MSRAGKQHPVETIAEWLAPVPLALAAGWSFRALGLPLVAVLAASFALFVSGLAAMRLAGGRATARPYRFEPVAFETETPEPGELVLEAKDELLELTDPLVEVAPDSRVVRLFQRQEPTPGELVNRITDFLGAERRLPEARTAPAEAHMTVDASAALHAALANIRASLR